VNTYSIDVVERHARECNRLLGVLEMQLNTHGKHWIIGDMYTIADICSWPWIYALYENYGGAINVKQYIKTICALTINYGCIYRSILATSTSIPPPKHGIRDV
jgi:glutathione S-transferase